MGDRLMVGLWSLAPTIGVQIPVPQQKPIVSTQTESSDSVYQILKLVISPITAVI
jgi:hypothetical protein